MPAPGAGTSPVGGTGEPPDVVPTSGEVRVAGVVPYEHRTANAKNIGVVFGQRSQLYWDLPLQESFELLRAIYAIPRDRYRQNLKDFVDILQMDDFLRTPVRQLSLGQRMRAEMAASMEKGCGIYRLGPEMRETCDTLANLKQRMAGVTLEDKSRVWNTAWP